MSGRHLLLILHWALLLVYSTEACTGLGSIQAPSSTQALEGTLLP